MANLMCIGSTWIFLRLVTHKGVVSEILNGKRELNLRQVRALAEKFKVSCAVFV
jgi:HTH-type transcriptional regulator / antitoxin HigA